VLDLILKDLPKVSHPDLLVGLGTADDAGVFRISPDTALIQTVDFFTPIVDDPFAYGQIAAANSLSDVYAMGGRPITALNICGFPSDDVPPEMIAEILKGAYEKVAESGAVLVGGHSVEDVEPKFGLSVTGIIHPDQVKTNAGAQIGDKLVLTKPLGTGLMSDAYQNDELSEDELQPAIEMMSQLNKVASEQMVALDAHGCTDITGFGLMGHGLEMAIASGVGFVIRSADVPLFEVAYKIAETREGGGLRRNRAARGAKVHFAESVAEPIRRLLFDPQTSGGLLIALAPEQVNTLIEGLQGVGIDAREIGDVVGDHLGEIFVV
jgi:selenide,water dikinase